MDNLKKHIIEINNFPKEGIVFKDINPLYRQPKVWNQALFSLEELITNIKPDFIAGIESRGFIIGSALSYKLGIGFIPIRKSNKLPGKVIGINYSLEYGIDRLELQLDSIKKSSRIIIVDDLLATGGTASTAGKLILKAGANLLGYCFLVELTKLKGKEKLDNTLIIKSVVKY